MSVVTLRIRRQDATDRPESQRWEQFEVSVEPRMTISAALERIENNPVTIEGRRVLPLAWQQGCLEDVCGACTMLINGRARHACGTLVAELSPRGRRIVIEPLSKFPVVRDLVVERGRLTQTLCDVEAWVEHDPATAAPELFVPQSDAVLALEVGRCTECGACLEACPEWGHNDFVGPAALNAVRTQALHPSGRLGQPRRLENLMRPGGIADCGKAQNCVEVCPRHIPLVDSIQAVGRDTSLRLIDWLLG
jgi:succinate dehydrogenase / fumarate reductase iron-sulfur subunit